MGTSEARYSEFYRLLDQAFLTLPSIPLEKFEARLQEIAKDFDSDCDGDPWFAHELKRELASRQLVASIEKDAGVPACMDRYRYAVSFQYEDVIAEWLIVCQMSKYLGDRSQRDLIMDHLLRLKEELTFYMEGCEESLKQLESEIQGDDRRQGGTD